MTYKEKLELKEKAIIYALEKAKIDAPASYSAAELIEDAAKIEQYLLKA